MFMAHPSTEADALVAPDRILFEHAATVDDHGARAELGEELGYAAEFVPARRDHRGLGAAKRVFEGRGDGQAIAEDLARLMTGGRIVGDDVGLLREQALDDGNG